MIKNEEEVSCACLLRYMAFPPFIFITTLKTSPKAFTNNNNYYNEDR